MKRLVLALCAFALVGAAPRTPFRVAVLSPTEGTCATLPPTADRGEKAYFEHLSRRLERQVQVCPVATYAQAAAALSAGKVDMAPLDAAGYAASAGSARAVLTVRAKGALSRTAVVAMVRAGASPNLKNRKVAFGGAGAAGLDQPRVVLAQQGAPTSLDREVVAADAEGAIAAVRAGRADAVVLHAGAWQRQCRGASPTEHPCADLSVVWRVRPAAMLALAVRKDLSDPERYRLIGVHVPMHLEDKAAFVWAAGQLGGNGAEFEAAEADALKPGLRR